MFHKGLYYAETIRSHRYKGVDTLTIHSFESKDEMDEFIHNYNLSHLDHESGAAPEVYTMAQTSSIHTLIDFGWKGIGPLAK